MIVECAYAATNVRNSYFHNFYFKLKSKRGGKKAIVAVARKMLVIIYHLIKNKELYNEDKYEQAKQKQETLRLKRMSKEANKLGYNLVPME